MGKAEAEHPAAVRLPGEELGDTLHVFSTHGGAVRRVFPQLLGSCSQSAAVQHYLWG